MKAQAALEFLMTYGWAILIVIAVVAALYAMGIFRLPGGGIAGPCSPCFPSGSAIAYDYHGSDALSVIVGPREINVTRVETTKGSADFDPPINGKPNSRISIPCTGCFAGDVEVRVTFQDVASGIVSSLNATLHGAT
ncbi:MAG: hypothetical protein QW451_02110 [Candidatus Aenigmatarchaeota archaeon]